MTTAPKAPPPSLLVVTGPPASGKTTLARALARELGWPLLAKDDIKETLFDTLGVGDRDWSQKLGGAAMELLAKLVRGQLEAGRDVVAEANFRWVGELPPCRVVQVYCDAPLETLMERIRARTRHPGHLEADAAHLAYVEESLRSGEYGPLPLDGPVIEYSVGSRSVDDVVAAVRAAFGG